MKKTVMYLSVSSLLAASLLFPITTSAAEINSNTVDVEGYQLTQYADGRVEGVNEPRDLSEEQKNEILKVIGYSDAEIASLSPSLKNELVIQGGVRVDSNITEVNVSYTDLEGTKYSVNENTVDTVTDAISEDLKKFNLPVGEEAKAALEEFVVDSIQDPMITPRNINSDGTDDNNFKIWGTVTYLGKTQSGVEFKHSIRNNFRWSKTPNFTFTDTIGISHISKTIPVGTNGIYDAYDRNWDKWFNYGFKKINNGLYGGSGEIDLRALHQDSSHVGYIGNETRTAVSQKGTTSKFYGAYSHAVVPEIAVMALSIYGIDVSGYGFEYDYSQTYTLPSS
ncbi:hypothetical protein [Paenibacillus sp. Marseille-Q7038]